MMNFFDDEYEDYSLKRKKRCWSNLMHSIFFWLFCSGGDELICVQHASSAGQSISCARANFHMKCIRADRILFGMPSVHLLTTFERMECKAC